jgi:hypothetical protein
MQVEEYQAHQEHRKQRHGHPQRIPTVADVALLSSPCDERPDDSAPQHHGQTRRDQLRSSSCPTPRDREQRGEYGSLEEGDQDEACERTVPGGWYGQSQRQGRGDEAPCGADHENQAAGYSDVADSRAREATGGE